MPVREVLFCINSGGPQIPIGFSDTFSPAIKYDPEEIELAKKYPMRNNVSGQAVKGFGKEIDGGYLELREGWQSGRIVNHLWLFRRGKYAGVLFAISSAERISPEEYRRLFGKICCEKDFEAQSSKYSLL
ncbi:MAG: hypothetical protein QW548_03475 [Candidatus Aenigmatarchaeota archaeon]